MNTDFSDAEWVEFLKHLHLPWKGAGRLDAQHFVCMQPALFLKLAAHPNVRADVRDVVRARHLKKTGVCNPTHYYVRWRRS